MKLLLSSAGLGNREVKKVFQEQIGTLKNKKLCLICYEMKEGFEDWLTEMTEMFREIIPGVKIMFLNLSEDIEVDNLPIFDAYYVSGGNTFFILGRMKELGIDKYLLKEIDKNKFYFGVSAGSMILGQDIERFASMLNDKNEVELKDCKGFGQVPFDIVPHYDKDFEQDIIKIYEENNIPVVALTDDQAVLVTDDEMEIIGPENEGLLLD